MTTPFAKSYIRYRKFTFHTGGVSYTPPQLSKLYNFPANLNGTGQKVAFIELGGSFNQTDLDHYFAGLGLHSPKVEFVSVDGGTNNPGRHDPADGEVMLDLCVAIGLANGITPIVYGATNTEQGFVDAINKAVADNVDVISISWGAPENNWSQSAIQAMNAAFQKAIAAGINVMVAAGDNGSGDGESGNHADFPASSPYVVGCGGTNLMTNGGVIVSETVWNNGAQGGATGGGLSAVFPIPVWQKGVGVPGAMRGVPDIAAVADPETGYVIIVNGQTMVVGGTSAVAPLWAALTAVLNQGLKKRIGFLNPLLYKSHPYDHKLLRDVTSGNNGTFIAKKGYDCCTGLGTPNGANLLQFFSGSPEPTTPKVTVSEAIAADIYNVTPGSVADAPQITTTDTLAAGVYSLTK